MNTLEAAQNFLGYGWSVFPVKPRSKKPLKSWEEFQSRLATSEELEVWFRQDPNNLGVVTGKLSCLLVLDVDVDPEKGLNGPLSLAELEREHGSLPPTVEVKTPRGGRHLFFQYPAGLDVRNSVGEIGEGLDVRAQGGYVCVPPSIHANGKQYEFFEGRSPGEIKAAELPEWLLKLLTTRITKPSSLDTVNGNGMIPEGSRNSRLTSLAGSMRHKGFDNAAIQAALLVHNSSNCNPPLPEDEIAAIAASVCRYNSSETTMAIEGEPSKLADLLSEVEAMFQKFVEFEKPELAALLALWVIQTYTLEHFNFCGFVSLQSASPRCGKSRLLELLSLLVADSPTVTTFPSAAVLFRSKRRVIILDEVDGLRNKDKEAHGDLMAILNCAFKRGAVVERVAKTREGFQVEAHNAYRAIALAGLEKLSDALTDRAFIVRMKRSSRRMPRLNIRTLEDQCQKLKAQIQTWVENNVDEIIETYSALEDETPELKGRDDRLQDIAEGPLTLALLADAEDSTVNYTARLTKAIEVVDGRRDRSNREEQLLAFLEIARTHLNGAEEIFVETVSILENCKEADSLGCIETGRELSNFLRNFDLFPFKKSGKVRGYQLNREWLQEWEKRYR